jgi:hypothetical protein
MLFEPGFPLDIRRRRIFINELSFCFESSRGICSDKRILLKNPILHTLEARYLASFVHKLAGSNTQIDLITLIQLKDKANI